MNEIMQFQIEDLGAVRKKVQIEIPGNLVDSTFATVYKQIATKVSLPGFRKGKVPASYIRKRYADQAIYQVTERLIDIGWKKLLDDEEVVPLSEPELDAEPVLAGTPFVFSMTFDVAPEIELKPFSDLTVEQESWTADESVVEHELIHLAEHMGDFQPVEDRDVAEQGDQVVFDYSGSVDGEVFAGGTSEDAELVLGSGQFIPGFEEQIVGKKVGSDFEVNVTFPEDYQAENLKGKAAIFACTLKSLKTKVTPEIGPGLAEKMGETDLDGLKAKLKEEIESRFNRGAVTEARDALRNVLGSQYEFDVPPSLLKSSLEDHRKSMLSAALQEGKSKEDANAEVDEKFADEEPNVVRDIRAYLVMDLIGRQENIEASEEDLRSQMMEMIQQAGPYAQQLLQMYSNPERRAGMMRKIRHDKVLDFLLTQANVTSVDRSVPAHECEHGENHANDNDA